MQKAEMFFNGNYSSTMFCTHVFIGDIHVRGSNIIDRLVGSQIHKCQKVF